MTRAREQASELRTRLETLGAEVIELPAITVEPVDFELPALADYAWIVFTSANGVDAFFDRGSHARRLDARALAGVQVAAIGPGTDATRCARCGVRADLVPERFVAESLLEAFPDPGARARVLLARAERRARRAARRAGRARATTVDVLPVYRTVPAAPDPADLARVRAGDVDAITFTSSSTVKNFCDAVGPLRTRNRRSSRSVRSRRRPPANVGLRVDAEADPHTIDGLVAAVLAVLRCGR